MRGVDDYAVVYDISCDRERRRVDRTLKGFGFRVQKSVFECRLNIRSRKDLQDKLEQLAVKTGFIKLYRLEYSTKNICVGEMAQKSLDDGSAFIV
jgi:CRISPR-associated protein Cas2